MSRQGFKRIAWSTSVALVLAGLSVGAYYASRDTSSYEIVSSPVTRADVVEVVSATGTLEALTTVQVGSQVSGTVQALYADFNSIVRRGDLVATLEPSLLETQAAQAKANVTKAAADVERSKVEQADAERQLGRITELYGRQLLPRTDLDSAESSAKMAAAQVRSAAAQLAQAQASLTQAEVNIQKTRIFAPIDGIVVNRNVDVGQTVAASMQAPTLFEIAADLRDLRLNAAIDESDVGRIREGQQVEFSVDAFPGAQFRGQVTQVRLQPVVSSNVVTYAVIIAVRNDDLRLRPGMTANLAVEIARSDKALRVPTAALRFRPTAEMLEAVGSGAAASNPAATRPAARETRLWVVAADRVSSMPVTTGITDGVTTEISGPGVVEGLEVVTQIRAAESSASSPASVSRSPLLGSSPGPGGPPPGAGGPPPGR